MGAQLLQLINLLDQLGYADLGNPGRRLLAEQGKTIVQAIAASQSIVVTDPSLWPNEPGV